MACERVPGQPVVEDLSIRVEVLEKLVSTLQTELAALRSQVQGQAQNLGPDLDQTQRQGEPQGQGQAQDQGQDAKVPQGTDLDILSGNSGAVTNAVSRQPRTRPSPAFDVTTRDNVRYVVLDLPETPTGDPVEPIDDMPPGWAYVERKLLIVNAAAAELQASLDKDYGPVRADQSPAALEAAREHEFAEIFGSSFRGRNAGAGAAEAEPPALVVGVVTAPEFFWNEREPEGTPGWVAAPVAFAQKLGDRLEEMAKKYSRVIIAPGTLLFEFDFSGVNSGPLDQALGAFFAARRNETDPSCWNEAEERIFGTAAGKMLEFHRREMFLNFDVKSGAEVAWMEVMDRLGGVGVQDPDKVSVWPLANRAQVFCGTSNPLTHFKRFISERELARTNDKEGFYVVPDMAGEALFLSEKEFFFGDQTGVRVACEICLDHSRGILGARGTREKAFTKRLNPDSGHPNLVLLMSASISMDLTKFGLDTSKAGEWVVVASSTERCDRKMVHWPRGFQFTQSTQSTEVFAAVLESWRAKHDMRMVEAYGGEGAWQ